MMQKRKPAQPHKGWKSAARKRKERSMNDDLRKQVALQCRVVAHMATAIAQVHSDKAAMMEAGGYDKEALLNLVGRFTARYMETLGDILNGMDAVTEEDDWTHPVFREAQRRWPDDGFQSI